MISFNPYEQQPMNWHWLMLQCPMMIKLLTFWMMLVVRIKILLQQSKLLNPSSRLKSFMKSSLNTNSSCLGSNNSIFLVALPYLPPYASSLLPLLLLKMSWALLTLGTTATTAQLAPPIHIRTSCSHPIVTHLQITSPNLSSLKVSTNLHHPSPLRLPRFCKLSIISSGDRLTEQFNVLIHNGRRELVEFPPNCSVTGFKWVLQINQNPYGSCSTSKPMWFLTASINT